MEKETNQLIKKSVEQEEKNTINQNKNLQKSSNHIVSKV